MSKEPTSNQKLDNLFWRASRRAWNERGVAWLPCVCPRCLGVLSAKMGSDRLVCLSCGCKFTTNQTGGKKLDS